MYNLHTRNLCVSRDVIFQEHVFLLQHLDPNYVSIDMFVDSVLPWVFRVGNDISSHSVPSMDDQVVPLRALDAVPSTVSSPSETHYLCFMLTNMLWWLSVQSIFDVLQVSYWNTYFFWQTVLFIYANFIDSVSRNNESNFYRQALSR